MTGPLRVEVFPVEPDRWVAVIGAPRGEFSTEADSAAGVAAEVRDSIRAVLEVGVPQFVLMDDLGLPWSPRMAVAQLQRLGVSYRPDRRSWWQRLVSRRIPFRGDCPVCGHEWREHLPAEGACSECRYEIEHGDPGAPTQVCRVMPRPPERPFGPACVIAGVSTDPERGPSVIGGVYEFWTDRDEPVRLHDTDLLSVVYRPGSDPTVTMRFGYVADWVPAGLEDRPVVEFTFGGATVADWSTPDPLAEGEAERVGSGRPVSLFDWDGHRLFTLRVDRTFIALTAGTLHVRATAP